MGGPVPSRSQFFRDRRKRKGPPCIQRHVAERVAPLLFGGRSQRRLHSRTPNAYAVLYYQETKTRDNGGTGRGLERLAAKLLPSQPGSTSGPTTWVPWLAIWTDVRGRRESAAQAVPRSPLANSRARRLDGSVSRTTKSAQRRSHRAGGRGHHAPTTPKAAAHSVSARKEPHWRLQTALANPAPGACRVTRLLTLRSDPAEGHAAGSQL